MSNKEVAEFTWAKAPAGVSYDWLVGTYYEKLWHVMFGTDPENCPSIADCRQRYFSNAIACSGDMDTTTWAVKGQSWKDVRCITAFDHAPLDKEPDFSLFHTMLVTTYGQLQLDKEEQRNKRTKAVERVKELEADVKNMTAQIKELGGILPEGVVEDEKKKGEDKAHKKQKTDGKHDGRIGSHDHKSKKAAKSKRSPAHLEG